MRLAALFCIIAFWSFNLAASRRRLLGQSSEESSSSIPDRSVVRYLRITGGSEAAPDEFPWHVALYDPEYDNVFCGGAIIGERHILTAAHCVSYVNFTYFAKVVTGTNVLAEYLGNQYDIKSVTIHDRYSHKMANGCLEESHNDIAVITLTEGIQLSDYETIIDLPSQKLARGVIGTFTGYGAEKVLKKLQVSVIDYDTCKRTYHVDIDPEQICSVSHYANERADRSDSGGPLVHNNTVVGIYTQGYDCTDTRMPAVYMNVYSYDEFIRNAMDST